MTVTEQDRERAMEIMAWDPLTYDEFRAAATTGQHPADLESLELVDAIAAALAEERERARAPFLALADEYERQADLMQAGVDSGIRPDIVTRLQAFRDSSESIRRVAEENA